MPLVPIALWAGAIEQTRHYVRLLNHYTTKHGRRKAGVHPELIPIKGELLNRKNASGAQLYFREAIDQARNQGALFWELRAAVSLAESLRDPGRATEGAAVLRPAYERFTEGLQMPFLRSARALLDTL